MATLQDLIDAVDTLQTSVTTLTTEVNVRKTTLDTAVTSASASAQAAATSELDAEAARDEIVSKIDFTGAQEGDIYRVNNAGVAVRINETDFLQSKVPFERSPLAGVVDLDSVFAWDSFNRPDGTIGNADSGQPWLNLGESPFEIYNNSATGSLFTGNLALIERITPVETDNIYTGGVGMSFNYFYNLSFSRNVIMKDLNNFFYFTIFQNSLFLGKVINGVQTGLTTVSFNRAFQSHGFVDLKLQRNTNNNGLFLTVTDSSDGIQRTADLSNEYSTYNPDEWKYIGFYVPSGNSPTATYYKNVIMYNL